MQTKKQRYLALPASLCLHFVNLEPALMLLMLMLGVSR